jgi:hypothetical protein
MSITKYIICILENSLTYFSQLYSPGKSSRIGWWRGNCKEAPPTTADVWLWRQWCGLPLFPRQVHTRTPPAGGGEVYTATRILCGDLYCALATACPHLIVLRLYVRFSRLNVRNRLKITKSTNFKACSSREAPSKPGRGGPGLRQTSWHFCTL